MTSPVRPLYPDIRSLVADHSPSRPARGPLGPDRGAGGDNPEGRREGMQNTFEAADSRANGSARTARRHSPRRPASGVGSPPRPGFQGMNPCPETNQFSSPGKGNSSWNDSTGSPTEAVNDLSAQFEGRNNWRSGVTSSPESQRIMMSSGDAVSRVQQRMTSDDDAGGMFRKTANHSESQHRGQGDVSGRNLPTTSDGQSRSMINRHDGESNPTPIFRGGLSPETKRRAFLPEEQKQHNRSFPGEEHRSRRSASPQERFSHHCKTSPMRHHQGGIFPHQQPENNSVGDWNTSASQRHRGTETTRKEESASGSSQWKRGERISSTNKAADVSPDWRQKESDDEDECPRLIDSRTSQTKQLLRRPGLHDGEEVETLLTSTRHDSVYSMTPSGDGFFPRSYLQVPYHLDGTVIAQRFAAGDPSQGNRVGSGSPGFLAHSSKTASKTIGKKSSRGVVTQQGFSALTWCTLICIIAVVIVAIGYGFMLSTSVAKSVERSNSAKSSLDDGLRPLQLFQAALSRLRDRFPSQSDVLWKVLRVVMRPILISDEPEAAAIFILAAANDAARSTAECLAADLAGAVTEALGGALSPVVFDGRRGEAVRGEKNLWGSDFKNCARAYEGDNGRAEQYDGWKDGNDGESRNGEGVGNTGQERKTKDAGISNDASVTGPQGDTARNDASQFFEARGTKNTENSGERTRTCRDVHESDKVEEALRIARTPEEVKELIDRALGDGFVAGSRAAVVRGLDRLHGRAAMMFHAYCDNENATHRRVAIIFTLHVTVGGQGGAGRLEGARGDRWVEERLAESWREELEGDKLVPLLSRIANSNVFVMEESDVTLDKLGC